MEKYLRYNDGEHATWDETSDSTFAEMIGSLASSQRVCADLFVALDQRFEQRTPVIVGSFIQHGRPFFRIARMISFP
jgi:hypothetical protein